MHDGLLSKCTSQPKRELNRVDYVQILQEDEKALTVQQSKIISTVLSPACRVWLRSQVSQIENLQVKIEGSDRQILSGYIPRVSIIAKQAVYQGLHLSAVELVGENIRINLGQVLRGKPLRLLEPIIVSGHVVLREADLKASLASPLLSTALTDLLGQLLESGDNHNLAEALKSKQITWSQASIDSQKVTLAGDITEGTQKQHLRQDAPTPIILRTGLELASPHELQLAPVNIETTLPLPFNSLNNFKIDLGSEVNIEELVLLPCEILCRGSLSVNP